MSFWSSWIQSLECLSPAPASEVGIADPDAGVLSVLVGVTHSFAEQEAHAVQSSALQVTLLNPRALYTVLSWIMRWAKASVLAVHTDQCHELRASDSRVSSNSAKSWVNQRCNATSCLSCSRVLPQQISVSLFQNTWYAKEFCILYRPRFYLKYSIKVTCTYT